MIYDRGCLNAHNISTIKEGTKGEERGKVWAYSITYHSVSDGVSVGGLMVALAEVLHVAHAQAPTLPKHPGTEAQGQVLVARSFRFHLVTLQYVHITYLINLCRKGLKIIKNKSNQIIIFFMNTGEMVGCYIPLILRSWPLCMQIHSK